MSSSHPQQAAICAFAKVLNYLIERRRAWEKGASALFFAVP
jgi:hypothetical protein